jgi:hypothetical protein
VIETQAPQRRNFRKGPAVISSVKILLEVLLSIVLHPIAVILMWINLFGRTDLNGIQKTIWAITGILWGIGPILYFLVGGGELW